MKILFCDTNDARTSAPLWYRSSLNLANALGKRGHEVYCLLPRYPLPSNPWVNIIFVKSLNELDGSFDIVQTSHSLRFTQKLVNLASKLNAKSVVWGFQDLFLDKQALGYMLRYELGVIKKIKRRFFFHLVGIIIPRSLRVSKDPALNFIASTRYLKKELISAGIIPDKTFVAPLGVDTQTFSPISDNARIALKSKMSINDRTVLFIGGYNALRGIGTVIKVFEIIKKEKRNVQPVLALFNAPNPFKGYRNLGFRQDLPQILNLADIVCLPYRSTNQMTSPPLTMLEAMSCGCAVVSTDVGAIPEVIDSGKDGILIHRGSELKTAQEVAQAIIGLLDDREQRERLGREARLKILSKHSLDEMAKGFELAYSQILPQP